MEKEEIIGNWAEAHDSEHCKFDRIPKDKQVHWDSDICGLMYLFSKLEQGDDTEFAASHDLICLPVPKSLTEDDFVYLLRCGLHWDSEFDCFGMYT